MTTVNTLDDRRISTLVRAGPNNLAQTYFDLGSLRSRQSIGGDRAPGTYPGKEKQPVIYNVKGYTHRGVVIRPPTTKVRYVWKAVPRQQYEQEHTYSATHLTHESEAGVCTWNSSVNNYFAIGDAGQLQLDSIVDPWDDNDELALIGKLRERIAGTDFNLGIALGESKMAVKLIADSATKIYKAIRQVKRGNLHGAAQTLTGRKDSYSKHLDHTKRYGKVDHSGLEKTVSQRWLELQYGWKPLVDDVYGAAVFLDHQFSRPRVYTVTVRRNAGGKMFMPQGYLSFPFSAVKLPVQFQSSTQIKARLTDVSNAGLAGLQNPAAVAWELVPWSFVVDWFIPIGSFLDAQGLAQSLSGGFVRTHRWTFKTMGKPVVISNSNHTASPWNDGSKIRLSYMKLNRTYTTSLQVPTPTIKPLSKSLTWAHATNAVALLLGSKR